MSALLDFRAVLSGEPLAWSASGLAVTVAVSAAGLALAAVIAVLLFSLRISPVATVRAAVAGVIGAIRNTPLLVQLIFWYFAGYATLPLGLRDWLIAEHPLARLPLGGSLLSPEFLTSVWGLGLFFGVFMAEELRAGLGAVAPGQAEAAKAQGLSDRDIFLRVLAPQAVVNAWQPLVGQALNLMKFSSLASVIGLAELTYQTRQVESLNARAFEVMTAGTVIYLLVGFGLGRLLEAVAPGRRWRRAGARHA